MFLIDDLLLSPIKGIIWLFREIHDAAQQELAGEGESITTALSELYMKLETGEITEAEFDSQEKGLLDRLDRLEAEEAPRAAPGKKPPGRRSRAKAPREKPPPPGSRRL
jgi:hypothetical protein